ncbi:alpha/beta hydrolase [Alteromonas sp. V450]|uniref:alpha/beta fold hydrolase n=1 Tax=Alteromonas sp. V450 TaxID=1912139 RepID=UPI0008FF3E87|nr:alpha/beta fold hydrolase [Alteromonas sp. V450]OJF68326.1 alpha/beta hydrolase [Alteromonas sp. V450]
MQLNYTLSETDLSKPWLVLIHGLFGSADNLSIVKRHFEPRFNILSVDLPDHGESPWTEAFDISSAANSVFNILQSLDIKKTAILGHSLGGKVAMRLALSHSEAITHLIVADIAPSAYNHSHQTVFDGLNAVPLDSINSRKEADAIMAEHIREAGVRQFLLKSLFKNDDGNWAWRFNIKGLMKSYEHIIDWETTDQTFTGITLFIKGAESDYITSANRQDIAKYFPNAKAHIIEGTGHWLHAEKPRAFNSVVERTLTTE